MFKKTVINQLILSIDVYRRDIDGSKTKILGRAHSHLRETLEEVVIIGADMVSYMGSQQAQKEMGEKKI